MPPKGSKRTDFVIPEGQVFNRLTVLRRIRFPGERDAFWECRCACGTILTVAGTSLRSGNTKSCGCLKNEKSGMRLRTHGRTKTPEHRSWLAAKQRCCNPRNKAWPYYGERGITMCERWRNSFEAFYADMGPRPSLQHSLGRIDNNGPYSPENCRWETDLEQARNTRNCRYVTFRGERMTQTEWCKRYGITLGRFKNRIRRGWDFEQALVTPVGHTRNKFLTFRGETKSINEWARLTGLHPGTIHSRISLYGYTVEEALTRPPTFGGRKNQVKKVDPAPSLPLW